MHPSRHHSASGMRSSSRSSVGARLPPVRHASKVVSRQPPTFPSSPMPPLVAQVFASSVSHSCSDLSDSSVCVASCSQLVWHLQCALLLACFSCAYPTRPTSSLSIQPSHAYMTRPMVDIDTSVSLFSPGHKDIPCPQSVVVC